LFLPMGAGGTLQVVAKYEIGVPVLLSHPEFVIHPFANAGTGDAFSCMVAEDASF
jgi:hypothetical protein